MKNQEEIWTFLHELMNKWYVMGVEDEVNGSVEVDSDERPGVSSEQTYEAFNELKDFREEITSLKSPIRMTCRREQGNNSN